MGFHGGKGDVRRPRLRSLASHEVPLPSWQAAQAEGWLGRWAMNLMLINVSTRKGWARGAAARGRSAGGSSGENDPKLKRLSCGSQKM
jgi:hypothetical protein